MKKTFLLVAITLVIVMPLAATPLQRAAAPAPQVSAGGTTAKAVAAANAFLATLGDAERAKALFPFTSPQKTNWSNLPSGIYERHSLRLGDVTPAQRDAAMALVAVVLSREGYQKVTDIMNGDEVLKNAGGGRTGGRQGAPAGGGRGGPGRGGTGRGGPGGGVQFGRDEYYIALLGAPSTTTPWLIQFGGHHLAINVTVVGANSALTPSLPAAQPARYTLNGQTIRPLGRE